MNRRLSREIDQLKGRTHASVSCKPTQLGIHESEAYCLENIRKVLAHERVQAGGYPLAPVQQAVPAHLPPHAPQCNAPK